jgi:hypothetical protein
MTKRQVIVVDGIPLLLEYEERELASLRRAHEAGNAFAAMEATLYCYRNRIPSPQWVLVAVARMQLSSMTKRKSGKVGRASTPFYRSRQDLIHFVRWDYVRTMREYQERTAGEVRSLRQLTPPPRQHLAEFEPLHKYLGSSWERAYEVVSDELCETESAGSPDAIKSSYLYVERVSRDPDQALRFKLMSRAIYEALGLLRVLEPPRVRKRRWISHPAS